MTALEIAMTALATAVAGYTASRRGGKDGSAGALNGTAEAVKRIETKLDGHVTQTAENFREISDRTSNIEGRLFAAETTKRPMRAARRKPS